MKLLCYVKDNKRIHVTRDDDGSLMEAKLLTNPPRGFRRKLISTISNEENLVDFLNTGFQLTFEKEL